MAIKHVATINLLNFESYMNARLYNADTVLTKYKIPINLIFTKKLKNFSYPKKLKKNSIYTKF